MVKRGPPGSQTAGTLLAMARSLVGRGRPKAIGPRLPGGAFKSKNAAKVLARAKVGVGRRRKVNNVQNIKHTPGLTSNSVFRSYVKPSNQVKAMKRVGAPNQRIINNANQYVCPEGFQQAFFWGWNNSQDINYMLAQTPNSTGGFKTNRFVLESSQFECLMTNSSLASCYVEIYDIARKRDANATEYKFTENPLAAWQQGVYNASGVSLLDWSVLRSSPFDSQVFKEWFKVVKRTRIELSQGATHKHSVILKPNKLIDAATPQFVDGDFAGLTMYTMVVFYGQPASLVGESGTSVTTAKIALDTVATSRYKYTWVSDTTQNVYITDNMVSLAGEQIVSTGAGDIRLNAVV